MKAVGTIVRSETLVVPMSTGPSISDLTRQLLGMVDESGVGEGVVHANIIGSTGSLTTIEFEPGVVRDLCDAIERLAPRELDYKHEEAWHDGNGHSHVQAALLGPSISVGLKDGRLCLGTWQQVVAINHDNRPRKRKIQVTLVGIPKP